MRFSIVIPVYQVKQYLPQCIDSILMQSFPDYELILVDDGSSDASPQICDDYAKVNGCIRVIHQCNRGPSAARNAGIRAAQGEYILLVDADDFLPECGILQELSDQLEEKQVDVLLFRIQAWDKGSNTYRLKNKPFDFTVLDRFDHNETLHYLFKPRHFPTGVYSLCVRRSLLIDREIFFVEGIKSEDYDWIFCVLRDCGRIHATNAIFYTYRVNRPGSITKTKNLNNLRDLVSVAEKWSDAPGFTDPILRRDVQNYAAYIYATALVVAGSFPKDQRKLAAGVLKEHRRAIRGARWFSIRLIRVIVCVLGIERSTVLLRRLYLLKLSKEFK